MTSAIDLLTERPTAGGPALYLSKSFGNTEEEMIALLPTFDVATLTISATNWLQFPELNKDVGIKFAEKSEDVMSIEQLFRTSDVVVEAGIEEIAYEFPRASLHALSTQLEGSILTSESATTTKVARDVLAYSATPKQSTYRHALLIFKGGADGYWKSLIFPKVRVAGNLNLKYGNSVATIPNSLKVFAHVGVSATLGNLMRGYQMTGPVSSGG